MHFRYENDPIQNMRFDAKLSNKFKIKFQEFKKQSTKNQKLREIER